MDLSDTFSDGGGGAGSLIKSHQNPSGLTHCRQHMGESWHDAIPPL